MRQNTFFSQFKQSLFEHLKPSSSTSTLDEEVENSKKLFYRDVLKKKLLKKCEIIEVEVLAHSSLTLPFAVFYQLSRHMSYKSNWENFNSKPEDASLTSGLFTRTVIWERMLAQSSHQKHTLDLAGLPQSLNTGLPVSMVIESIMVEFMKQILHFVVDE